MAVTIAPPHEGVAVSRTLSPARAATVLAAPALAALLLLAGCSAPPPAETAAPGASDAPEQSLECAQMVTNSGGLNDRSFNETSWAGMERAQEELGVEANVLVSTTESDLAPNVQAAVDTGCGFVLTVGYELAAATAEQAEANPDVQFAIVDEIVEAPNVRSIVFDTAQAAFLAGYAAASVSETGTVATFGGGNQPPVTLFMDGFAAGIDAFNEAKGADVQLLGWDPESQDGTFTGDFENVSLGQSQTQAFIAQGADVILPVAGQVGEGAFRASLDAGGEVLVLWVDNDGYDTLPEEFRPLLLTSVLKNTEDAVVGAVADAADGTISDEPIIGTLENGGVDIAPFHDLDDRVSDETKAELDALREQIIAGEITVESPSSP
ncbi:BMP family ABC transporter substrate-binding protein [Agrococcus sediminis]|uniref:BMP family ABC transporter substrate-binding protein n=1 Tax=Agrococcus sediminis TaxID=2599924 RepID=A0A5M8Q4W8_9MICO|nr:BMP family ABC transporter substrate-binding protein [Agrococcus sediminis]RWR25338.1 BMP family ABC transporter substrate-binding protein [Agrococcus lahaulensis]